MPAIFSISDDVGSSCSSCLLMLDVHPAYSAPRRRYSIDRRTSSACGREHLQAPARPSIERTPILESFLIFLMTSLIVGVSSSRRPFTGERGDRSSGLIWAAHATWYRHLIVDRSIGLSDYRHRTFGLMSTYSDSSHLDAHQLMPGQLIHSCQVRCSVAARQLIFQVGFW